MSRYRIERSDERTPSAQRQMWNVRHYVDGDPNPTITSRKPTALPQAWCDALGSAAKQCIIKASMFRDVFVDVEVQDGRTYRVRVERIK